MNGLQRVTGSYIKRVRLELKQTQPQFARNLSRITGEKIDSKALCRLENYCQRDACHSIVPTQALEKAVVSLFKNPTSTPDMHMERQYYVRNKLRRIEQLEGVVAIRFNSNNRSQIDVDRDQLNISQEELEVFGNAGWVFRKTSEHSNDFSRSAPAEETPSSKVFRRPEDGSIMIGTQALIVQLQPKFSPEVSQDRLKEKNLSIRRKLNFAKNLYEVIVPTNVDPIDEANKLQEDRSAFIFAEPVMIENMATRCVIPEINSHQSTIYANTAWTQSRGENMRVAVIDNSFDIQHEALKAGIARESGYFLDDDVNQFRQGLSNYPSPNSDSSHGTFCAGIVGARIDNGCCGLGIAHESQLLLISCQPDQLGTQATLARAIAYATDPSQEEGVESTLGADVICCSLGPNGKNKSWSMQTVLELAINYAIQSGRDGRGTPLFWATNNVSTDLSQDEVCSHPNVIAVGRSNSNDTADGSAYGEIDFLAPGKNVYSTLPNNQYGMKTGTSYSTPCAAGVAALVLSINPDLDHTQVRTILRDTCDKVGGVTYQNGRHPEYGFGRINATRAVEVSLSQSRIREVG